MKYVSEIKSTLFESESSMVYLLNRADNPGTAVVRDTESSNVEIVDILQLDDWSHLGVGFCYMSCEGSVVCHTKKTAMLHHYINSVRMTDGVPIRDFVTSYKFDIGSMYGYEALNSRELHINTKNLSLDIIGLLGSVCIWPGADKGHVKIYTLYDTLGCLFRETGVNLLKYKKIVIYNNVRPIQTTIEFDDDAEANRFFNKMYFDVCGGYK